MSKPTQPPPKSNARTLYVVLVAAGALVLTVAAVFLMRGSPNVTPAADASSESATGTGSTAGPRLAVAQAEFDYGDVKVNTPIETVFRLKNTGNAPLQILDKPQVEVVEGC